MADGRVYHYTAWARLPAIVSSGFLRPSNASAAGEAPLLWFSSHPMWEPTATKLVRTSAGLRKLSPSEMKSLFGLARFALPARDARLMDWRAACRFAGTPRDLRRRLEVVGRKQGGNPGSWFACASAVALEQLDLEVFQDAWRPAVAAEAVAAWAAQEAKEGAHG